MAVDLFPRPMPRSSFKLADVEGKFNVEPHVILLLLTLLLYQMSSKGVQRKSWT